jgi:hypothetical protein
MMLFTCAAFGTLGSFGSTILEENIGADRDIGDFF